jgi:hypothetical protein
MTLERQRKTSLYVKRILSPAKLEPQVIVNPSTQCVTQKLELKLAILGPGGCGKSALATRILARSARSTRRPSVPRRFITEYCPVLEGIYSKALSLPGLDLALSVWDTSEPWGADYRKEQIGYLKLTNMISQGGTAGGGHWRRERPGPGARLGRRCGGGLLYH